MKRQMKQQFIQYNHSTQSFIDEAPGEVTDETTIHSTQSLNTIIQHNHSTQSFIDEVTGEAPDETTIHSTQSSTQSFIGEVPVECLMNANEPKIKRMIKGNKLFYYHH